MLMRAFRLLLLLLGLVVVAPMAVLEVSGAGAQGNVDLVSSATTTAILAYGQPVQRSPLIAGSTARFYGGTERSSGVAGSSLPIEADFVAAETAGSLAESGTLNPAAVRFSQDSISATFKNGGDVKQLAADLESGVVNPSSIPPIRVLQRGGNTYTLDNRRLAAFQQAGVNVPYRLATPEEIANEGWKFTTQNDGTSILIRGGG